MTKNGALSASIALQWFFYCFEMFFEEEQVISVVIYGRSLKPHLIVNPLRDVLRKKSTKDTMHQYAGACIIHGHIAPVLIKS